jgi:hypothetical protein
LASHRALAIELMKECEKIRADVLYGTVFTRPTGLALAITDTASGRGDRETAQCSLSLVHGR